MGEIITLDRTAQRCEARTTLADAVSNLAEVAAMLGVRDGALSIKSAGRARRLSVTLAYAGGSATVTTGWSAPRSRVRRIAGRT